MGISGDVEYKLKEKLAKFSQVQSKDYAAQSENLKQNTSNAIQTSISNKLKSNVLQPLMGMAATDKIRSTMTNELITIGNNLANGQKITSEDLGRAAKNSFKIWGAAKTPDTQKKEAALNEQADRIREEILKYEQEERAKVIEANRKAPAKLSNRAKAGSKPANDNTKPGNKPKLVAANDSSDQNVVSTKDKAADKFVIGPRQDSIDSNAAGDSKPNTQKEPHTSSATKPKAEVLALQKVADSILELHKQYAEFAATNPTAARALLPALNVSIQTAAGTVGGASVGGPAGAGIGALVGLASGIRGEIIGAVIDSVAGEQLGKAVGTALKLGASALMLRYPELSEQQALALTSSTVLAASLISQGSGATNIVNKELMSKVAATKPKLHAGGPGGMHSDASLTTVFTKTADAPSGVKPENKTSVLYEKPTESTKILPDSTNHFTAKEKIVANPYLVKEYVKEIGEITKLPVPDKQVSLLKEALQTKEFVKLSDLGQKAHRKEFNKIRNKLIAEWEQNTGQKWPVFQNDIYNHNQTKILRNKNDKFDAHHIIQLDHGGPNTWWNIHPADGVVEHKLIHGTGSKANEIFKPKKE